MWGGVATRKHTPDRVYVADEAGNELMLFGTVRPALLHCVSRKKLISEDV